MVERQEGSPQEQQPEQKREPEVKLSKRTMQVLRSAKDLTDVLMASFIGTKQILQGLIQEKSIRNALRAVGINPRGLDIYIHLATLREEGPEIIDRSHQIYNSQEIQLSPRAKSVIDLAREEAKTDSQQEVLPFHLLIGIIRHGENPASEILESRGLSKDSIALFKNVCKISDPVTRPTAKQLLKENPTVGDIFRKGIMAIQSRLHRSDRW